MTRQLLCRTYSSGSKYYISLSFLFKILLSLICLSQSWLSLCYLVIQDTTWQEQELIFFLGLFHLHSLFFHVVFLVQASQESFQVSVTSFLILDMKKVRVREVR